MKRPHGDAIVDAVLGKHDVELGRRVERLEAERDELIEALAVCVRWMQHGFMRDVLGSTTVSDDAPIAKVRKVLPLLANREERT